MHLLIALALAACPVFVSAKVLLSYNASAGEPTSKLGLLNLAGWDDVDWPSGQGQNSSEYFMVTCNHFANASCASRSQRSPSLMPSQTSTDPDGVPAAHVHKDAHFARAEYHMLKDSTAADMTY